MSNLSNTQKPLKCPALLSFCLLNYLSFASLSQAQQLQPEINCNQQAGQYVMTSEGLKPIEMFCDRAEQEEQVVKVDVVTQVVPKIPQKPFGKPYKMNGNVCRDRSGDLICVTPKSAPRLKGGNVF